MSEMKPITLYVNQYDFEQAEKMCDLGDYYPVDVGFYPHKDHLPKLKEFVEKSAFDKAIQALRDIELVRLGTVDQTAVAIEQRNLARKTLEELGCGNG